MKPFSDFNKQIETLENRNLTILDRKAANLFHYIILTNKSEI